MDEQIRRDEAQVMFDIFENWPTTASTRRAMQQHILGLQIKLDAAIAAAQPVPAEGAQAQRDIERDESLKTQRFEAWWKNGGKLECMSQATVTDIAIVAFRAGERAAIAQQEHRVAEEPK
jgi:hypothetical protein